jgi:hypothetical protein
MGTFARPFEGTVRIRLNAETNTLFLDRGVQGSTLTASDANEIAAKVVEAATKHKAGLNRWTFYVKGESEKLGSESDAILPASAVAKALKAGYRVTLRAVKWGKPSLWLVPADDAPKAKTTKFVDIA